MYSTLGLSASRGAAIDALRDRDASVTLQIVSIVGFALLTALGAQLRIYLWEVPFTLQTLAVYGSGLYLGWRNGLAAQLLYLVMGLFLPVYAGDGYGVSYLLSAVSAGYLLAYPASSAIAGVLSKRLNGPTGIVLSLLASSLVLFAGGVVWLHYAADHTTWFESIEKGWLRFIPVDLAKILFVTLVYSGSRRVR